MGAGGNRAYTLGDEGLEPCFQSHMEPPFCIWEQTISRGSPAAALGPEGHTDAGRELVNRPQAPAVEEGGALA